MVSPIPMLLPCIGYPYAKGVLPVGKAALLEELDIIVWKDPIGSVALQPWQRCYSQMDKIAQLVHNLVDQFSISSPLDASGVNLAKPQRALPWSHLSQISSPTAA